MAASVFRIPATGNSSISASFEVPARCVYRIVSVSLKLSAAPSTSENFTITMNSIAGTVYDVLLYSLDLSSGSTTDLVWFPDESLYLIGGDVVDVAYNNTDGATYGLLITAKAA